MKKICAFFLMAFFSLNTWGAVDNLGVPHTRTLPRMTYRLLGSPDTAEIAFFKVGGMTIFKTTRAGFQSYPNVRIPSIIGYYDRAANAAWSQVEQYVDIASSKYGVSGAIAYYINDSQDYFAVRRAQAQYSWVRRLLGADTFYYSDVSVFHDVRLSSDGYDRLLQLFDANTVLDFRVEQLLWTVFGSPSGQLFMQGWSDYNMYLQNLMSFRDVYVEYNVTYFSPVRYADIEILEAGTVTINSKGTVIKVPGQCKITSDGGMACPFDVQSHPAAFQYTSLGNQLTFRTGVNEVSIRYVSGGWSGYVYYSKEWLAQNLNNKPSNVVKRLGTILALGFAPFDVISTLTIERGASFAVGIAEVKPGSSNEGIVGQSGIRIPYLVTQSGDSKATLVKISVSDDNPNSSVGADSCAFHTDLNNPSDQVIAVPVRLNFYNPNTPSSTLPRSPGCNNIPMEIATPDIPWFWDIDTTGTYTGLLGLDLVFDLNSSAVQTDINGRYWQGKASGSGKITVEATWVDSP